MQLDFVALSVVQSFSYPMLDAAFKIATNLGEPTLWIMVAALLYWANNERKSFFLMNTIVFTAALVVAAKNVFQLPRPSPEQFRVLEKNPYWDYNRFGFPSGHAALATAGSAFLAKTRQKKAMLVIIAIVALTAVSRMYLGAHFLSDVIGGIAIGALIGLGLKRLDRRLEKSHFKLTKLGDEIALLVVLAAAIIMLVFFLAPAQAAIILGYYAGFFFAKEKGYSQARLFSRKKISKKLLLGTLSTAAIAFFGWIAQPIMPIAIALFFCAGAWISYGYPRVFETRIENISPAAKHTIYKKNAL